MVARVLSIAGSDSGGGAGIQADIKTISALGGHPMTAVTAVTAQNTAGVIDARPMEPTLVRRQIEAVVFDIGVDAVKTGMLPTIEIIDEVAAVLSELRLAPIVVDPVLSAESGAELVADVAAMRLMERLVPLAAVVTPNSLEAARLLGRPVGSVEEQEEAARAFVEAGAAAAVVKGGHVAGDDAVDVVCVGGVVHELRGQRLAASNTHGTGCTMASAIAVYLAGGDDVLQSVSKAKEFVTEAIRNGLELGDGPGPVDQLGRTNKP